jgi:tripartite-type tricarboxylate transporter receptor subunit TctC
MMKKQLTLVGAALFFCTAAVAENWPDKPIKLVVPYPAGGGVDSVARILGLQLSKILGQQIIVDNKSGASGAIGAHFVVTSPPDGYTFLLASPAEVLVSPIAGQSMPYDPNKDLVPVALAGETPLAIVAHPSVAPDGLAALLKNPAEPSRKRSYGTPGAGSTMHFAGEALKAGTGLGWLHVPYKGAAPAVNDVLGNQIDIVIVGLPPVIPHIKSGRLTALAVTSLKRSPVLPNVPAVSEFPKMEGFRFTNWMGVFAPVGTPDAAIERFGRAVEEAVKDPSTSKRLLEAGVEPNGVRGAGFEKFLAEERNRYQDVARRTNVKVN